MFVVPDGATRAVVVAVVIFAKALDFCWLRSWQESVEPGMTGGDAATTSEGSIAASVSAIQTFTVPEP
jgi:hypothetical protein